MYTNNLSKKDLDLLYRLALEFKEYSFLSDLWRKTPRVWFGWILNVMSCMKVLLIPLIFTAVVAQHSNEKYATCANILLGTFLITVAVSLSMTISCVGIFLLTHLFRSEHFRFKEKFLQRHWITMLPMKSPFNGLNVARISAEIVLILCVLSFGYTFFGSVLLLIKSLELPLFLSSQRLIASYLKEKVQES